MSAFTATKETAWLMPLFKRRALIVQGSERKSWLNGLVTCDVGKLASEAAIYGLALQKNGRIVSDIFVLEDRESLFAFAPSEVAEELSKTLDAYLIMEDATVALADLSLRAVLGPLSEAIAKKAEESTSKMIVRSYDGWGVPAVLIASEEDTDTVLREATLGLGGRVGTEEEWAQLRAHGFIPAFGSDFDHSMYPQEAGLETRAVSFSKGCYLGQEVVCMLEMRGQVRRKLALISYEGEPLPPDSKVLSTTNEAAGETKSAILVGREAPQTLGFAMVKRTLADVGTDLLVVGADGATRNARVVERTWP